MSCCVPWKKKPKKSESVVNCKTPINDVKERRKQEKSSVINNISPRVKPEEQVDSSKPNTRADNDWAKLASEKTKTEPPAKQQNHSKRKRKSTNKSGKNTTTDNKKISKTNQVIDTSIFIIGKSSENDVVDKDNDIITMKSILKTINGSNEEKTISKSMNGEQSTTETTTTTTPTTAMDRLVVQDEKMFETVQDLAKFQVKEELIARLMLIGVNVHDEDDDKAIYSTYEQYLIDLTNKHRNIVVVLVLMYDVDDRKRFETSFGLENDQNDSANVGASLQHRVNQHSAIYVAPMLRWMSDVKQRFDDVASGSKRNELAWDGRVESVAQAMQWIALSQRWPKPPLTVHIVQGCQSGTPALVAALRHVRVRDRAVEIGNVCAIESRLDEAAPALRSIMKHNNDDSDFIVAVLMPSGERALDAYLLNENVLDTFASVIKSKDKIVLCVVYNDENMCRRDFTKYKDDAAAKAKHISSDYLPHRLATHQRLERQSNAPQHRIAPLLSSQTDQTKEVNINLNNDAHAIAGFLARRV